MLCASLPAITRMTTQMHGQCAVQHAAYVHEQQARMPIHCNLHRPKLTEDCKLSWHTHAAIGISRSAPACRYCLCPCRHDAASHLSMKANVYVYAQNIIANHTATHSLPHTIIHSQALQAHTRRLHAAHYIARLSALLHSMNQCTAGYVI
jgi:hypothetical protein